MGTDLANAHQRVGSDVVGVSDHNAPKLDRRPPSTYDRYRDNSWTDHHGFKKRMTPRMHGRISAGIPSELEYLSTLQSDEFRDMEVFSDEFLSTNEDTLREYGRKSVRDPLHQWSRQSEYPFVLSRIQSCPDTGEKRESLDAGSGITFLVDTVTSSPTPTGTLTGGSETLTVGATLHVGISQVAGTYTATFIVTVAYN